MKNFKYPVTRREDFVESLHGLEIPDPYRWMENIDDEETRKWIEAQNEVTFDFLAHIPAREKIRQRITELWDFEKFGPPHKRGGKYFYLHKSGLQNQFVLYWMRDLSDKPKVLLDPNILSKDGTVALTGFSISEDGKFLAYGLSSAGSDWQDWHVKEIESGLELSDHLKWIKFSVVSWSRDGKGFYYSRYDEPTSENQYKGANYNQKLYYHRTGTLQMEDKLIYARPDHPEWGFSASVSEDGRYLIVTVWKGTHRENALFYIDLGSNDRKIIELLNNFDAGYGFLGNDDGIFYIQSDLDAPMERVISINTAKPQRAAWQEIIPETSYPLQSISMVKDKFIAVYLEDAHSVVKLIGLDGKVQREVELPGLGSVGGFDGRRENTERFFIYTDFTTPGTVYRYDFDSGFTEKFQEPDVKFNPDDFHIEQVFYHSKDGTRVPMFLTYRKGLDRSEQTPTFLTAYGGFGNSSTPVFFLNGLVWMELGGISAVANVRGGGEYGKQWHEAGMKSNKQNTFDDFIAAAEWLIENNYTCSTKLAIGGASNGGLTVAASMIQRPELFAACIPRVGVFDMLRFHKFTIGWAWISDYGSPDDAEEFEFLLGYSPYHNLKPGASYPAVLALTGDHDDRVFPAHSFKFTAALQVAQGGDKPVLIRVETRTGHGVGKPTSKIIESMTDEWAFLVDVLEMVVE